MIAILAVGLLCGLLLVWWLAKADRAWTFSLAIAASILSGNAFRVGFPIGPDRLLFAYGIALLGWDLLGKRRATGRWMLPEPKGRHYLALLLAALVALSGVASHEITQPDGFFAWLDRLGAMPFLMAYLAPVVFRGEHQRTIFLAVLTAVGLYLAYTSIFPFVGLSAIVFPGYIVDPLVGIHADRARGPFVAAVANGIALIACGTAAAVGFRVFRERWARRVAALTVALTAVSVLFTLTRSIWIASAAGAVVGALLYAPLRKYTVAGAAVGVATTLLLLATIPTLQTRADDRAASQSPIWDRINTNKAALRIAREEPLVGVGWNRFPAEGRNYLRQSEDVPLTPAAVGLQVHNVALSYVAELGIPIFALWVVVMALVVFLPIFERGPPAREPWRAGLGTLAVAWLIVGMLAPLGYAFPLLVLFTWAGITSSAHDFQRNDLPPAAAPPKPSARATVHAA